MPENIVGEMQLDGREKFAEELANTVVAAVLKAETAGKAALRGTRAGPTGPEGELARWSSGATGTAGVQAALKSIEVPLIKSGELLSDYKKHLHTTFKDVPGGKDIIAEALRSQEERLRDLSGRYAASTNAVRAFGAASLLAVGPQAAVVAQMGYAVVYLGRFTQSAGGLSAAMAVLGSTAANFLKSLGPIGLAIGTATAAYFAITKVLEGYTSAQRAADEANQKSRGVLREYNDELQRNLGLKDAMLGGATENPVDRDQAISKLQQKVAEERPLPVSGELMTSLLKGYIGQLENENRYRYGEKKWSKVEMEHTAMRQYEESVIGRKQKDVLEARARDLGEGIRAIDENIAAKAQIRRIPDLTSLYIRAGGKRSDLLPEGGLERELALWDEKLDALRGGKSARGGFGISSIEAERFRFAEPKYGMTFGEQKTDPVDEIKKTNKFLADITNFVKTYGLRFPGLGG